MEKKVPQERPWYVSVPIEIWCRRGRSRLGLLIGVAETLLGILPSRVLNAMVRGVMGVDAKAGERGVSGIRLISNSNFLSSQWVVGDSTSSSSSSLLNAFCSLLGMAEMTANVA